MKRCSHCRLEQPLSEFYKDNTRGGHQRLCKACMRKRERLWRENPANRDRERAGARRRRSENPERFREKDAQEREQRKDIRKMENARWREVNASVRATYEREYRTANPDLRRKWEAERRAHKRNAHVEHVHPLVVLERGDGICGICHADVDPLRFDVDHIDPLATGGEHSYANTQPAHPSCNYRKGHRVS